MEQRFPNFSETLLKTWKFDGTLDYFIAREVKFLEIKNDLLNANISADDYGCVRIFDNV